MMQTRKNRFQVIYQSLIVNLMESHIEGNFIRKFSSSFHSGSLLPFITLVFTFLPAYLKKIHEKKFTTDDFSTFKYPHFS